MASSIWDAKDAIKAVLLDISGVLIDNDAEGKSVAIPGSVNALNRLKSSNLQVRLCTNETTRRTEDIAAKLRGVGYDVDACDIFAPAPAARQMMTSRGLRPHLLVHPNVLGEFEGLEMSQPNCVVLGDAQEHFTYEAVNSAFNILVGLDEPTLISMGQGKYYKEGNGLALDVGFFMKGLEFACSIEAEVVGKPAPAFFMAPLQNMGVQPTQAVMVGDDIQNDVGGAQAVGLRGVQVRTGKFRPCDEPHSTVTPDAYVDNLAQFVDMLLDV